MKKRTKKAYAKLHDDPASLFSDVNVTLFPNGEREIWIQDEEGRGFRIRAGKGPAGVGLQISRFVLASPVGLSVSGNRVGDYERVRLEDDAAELEIVQHYDTDHAQAHRRWYRATPEERERDDIKHPDAPKCGGAVR